MKALYMIFNLFIVSIFGKTICDSNECYSIDVGTDPAKHKIENYTLSYSTGETIKDPLVVFGKIAENTVSRCPDALTEVVVFAPNNIPLEQSVSENVLSNARKAGYKSVGLFIGNATRDNFLSYCKCPNLKALFYDGDASPEMITTFDSVVTFADIALMQWKYQLVTYWLACEAYNDPMLSSVITASPRRWAAGINDLIIGPSDVAASFAMINAFKGQLLTESFNDALRNYDTPADYWGIGGFGGDMIDGPI